MSKVYPSTVGKMPELYVLIYIKGITALRWSGFSYFFHLLSWAAIKNLHCPESSEPSGQIPRGHSNLSRMVNSGSSPTDILETHKPPEHTRLTIKISNSKQRTRHLRRSLTNAISEFLVTLVWLTMNLVMITVWFDQSGGVVGNGIWIKGLL